MTLKNSVCVFICDLGVSSWWNMTETPPKGGVQGHPIQMPELVLLSVEEQQLFSELLSTSARDNGRKTPPSWERSCRANQSVLLDFMRICCVLSFHLHKPLRTCCRSDLHYNRRFTRSLTPPSRLNQ